MTLVSDAPAPAGTDDVDLIRLIGVGDRDALSELYRRHAGWLMVRLSRRCGDSDMVDTALQDTFLAVWRQASGYRPVGEVGAWMWTIALRRLIDQLRKKPPPQPVDEIEHLALVISDEVPLALGHTDMGAAFKTLQPELQAVMACTALDGLTNAETAALLGLPVGTVKSRLSRARQQLKEALG